MRKPGRTTSGAEVSGIPGSSAWLGTAGRPLLVDYSGLRVYRPLSRLLTGQAGYRPAVLLFAVACLLAVVLLPVPESLADLLEATSPRGYDSLEADTETILDSVNYQSHPEAFEIWRETGGPIEAAEGLDSAEELARRALTIVGILFVAALLWGTEALPIGGTVVVVAVLMFVFGILPPHEIPKAFVNDAVFFILGILAVAVGLAKTGLDKRIGLLLLSRIKSAWAFAFIFFPILAIFSGFLSAHALVALLVPVMMGVYKATCISQGIKQDRVLAIFLLLEMSYAANIGGPGSPVAGARNAIMVGYLADAGVPIGFGQWMSYGLPLVPVLALCVGAYMYIRCKPRLIPS